jgi:Fe-S oxidoreductase
MKEFEKSGARILITSNPGCRIQWEAVFARRKSPAQVLHPVELLAENLKEKL